MPHTHTLNRPRRADLDVDQLEERCFPSVVSVGPNLNISKEKFNQVEAAIAVNPTDPNNIVAVSMDEDIAGSLGYFFAVTRDGGRTWKTRHIATGHGGLPQGFSDPQMAFDKYGNLFLVYLDGFAGHVALSTNGGQSFHELAKFNNIDQPSVATGHNSVWVSFSSGNAYHIGATGARVKGLGQVGKFTRVKLAPGGTDGDFGDVAVGPAGQVMVTYQVTTGIGPDHIYTNVDTHPFAQGFGPRVTASGTNVGGNHHVPAQDLRHIDAEANLAWYQGPGKYHGRVYLVYVNAPSPTSPATKIFVRHSVDQGAHWSKPVAVIHDTTTNSKFQPSIAVDQATGNVVVAWLDAREDPGNQAVKLYVAFSTDGGRSFATNVAVAAGASNSADSEPPPDKWPSSPGPMDYGDFLQDKSAFVGGVFYPVWPDNSNSTGDNPNGTLHRLNLYTAAVTLTPGPGPQTVLPAVPASATTSGGAAASVSVAFGPSGEVLEVVAGGTLTQIDRTGAHVVGGGVRSAGVAFQGNHEVLLVTYADGTLVQFDSGGAHVVGGGVRSAGVAFQGNREVIDLVTQDGELLQFDPSGVRALTGGLASVSVAFKGNQEVLDWVTQTGVLVQLDAAGLHVLGGGVLSAGVGFQQSREVLEVVFQDGVLFQFDSTSAHLLGRLF
jgi:hypothetical protein